MMAAASYLLGFVTGIIMLLIEKQSKFVRFHAMQSTLLFGGVFVANIALGFIPILGWLVGLFFKFRNVYFLDFYVSGKRFKAKCIKFLTSATWQKSNWLRWQNSCFMYTLLT